MRSKQVLMKEILNRIQQSSTLGINIMEVCGTHTQAVSKFGIRQLVEPNIRLLSGPGCPVCVTSEAYIDSAINLLQNKEVILTTFGDMMKVNGSKGNLTLQKEKGKDVRVVYTPMDSIVIAEENIDKEVVFLAVGFETTAPLVALAIKMVKAKKLKNISFLIGLKRMEPILHQILSDPQHHIHGLICPGHVAAVKGADYFKHIVEQYNISAVIAGFEELDIVGALYFLQEDQVAVNKSFQNFYRSCVSSEGNKRANQLLEEIFEYSNDVWRGIGTIESSGLSVRQVFRNFDAAQRFGIKLDNREAKTCCICSDILLGKKLPNKCEYFGNKCIPSHPVGPCMVSSEGACSIFYKYKS